MVETAAAAIVDTLAATRASRGGYAVMEDSTKSKSELVAELQAMRERLGQLEGLAAEYMSNAEQLRDTERHNRAWLEHSPVCTKIVDLDFNLQYMSHAGVAGLQIDDITEYYGHPYPFEFYPQSFRDKMNANLVLVKETGAVITQEAPVEDVNGNMVWFHSTLVPVNDDDGKLDYIMVVSIDITERVQAEEEGVELERQVLHGQKLESLGVLAGGIAHDFNNILMSVLGNADLALDQLATHAPARANIKEIEKASKRAADLARQLLAYSGKGRFVLEQIHLEDFVEEMGHLLEVSISKKVILKYDFSDNLPTIEGDPTQIQQIIMNLITNASEALGDESGVISLSTGMMECDDEYLRQIVQVGPQEQPAAGTYAYLEVSDNGCGMDESTLQAIFDPFYTTKQTGRGLGMSAVLGIMRGHKGCIKIYSELGKGTTFKVLFPLGEGSDSASPRASTSSEIMPDWEVSGTILIADDEDSVCTVAGLMLERFGFSVLIAQDGREAIDLYRLHENEIVCTILDLTMPNVDGEQAFREIRRLNPAAPVVLSSGYNQQDATQKFIGKGLAGFIQKPYNMAGLRTMLEEVLDFPKPH